MKGWATYYVTSLSFVVSAIVFISDFKKQTENSMLAKVVNMRSFVKRGSTKQKGTVKKKLSKMHFYPLQCKARFTYCIKQWN